MIRNLNGVQMSAEDLGHRTMLRLEWARFAFVETLCRYVRVVAGARNIRGWFGYRDSEVTAMTRSRAGTGWDGAA